MNSNGGSAPSPDEVDDAVSVWHDAPEDGQSLADYLGWTAEEYEAWLLNPRAIPQRPLKEQR